MIRLLVCWEVPTPSGHLGGHVYASVDALTEAALEQICADLHAKLAAGNTLTGAVELRSVLPLMPFAEAGRPTAHGAAEGGSHEPNMRHPKNGSLCFMAYDRSVWRWAEDRWMKLTGAEIQQAIATVQRFAR